jgi:type IV secretion system protein TrbL
MGVCEIPVVSTVCHAVSKAASSVVSAPFDWIAEGVGSAAAWMFKGVWQLFDSTTLVNLTEPNYLKVYDILFGVAIFVMLLFFTLQLITGLIGRDPGALRRAAVGLGKSVLGSFVVVSVTALALEITDELCVGIIQATGTTLQQMGGKIAALGAGIGAISLADSGEGAVIVIFLGVLAITAAAIVWGSLLIRKALLLVAVVLAPFALAGQSWDAARGWFSKWASFVVALIVSKLVVVVIFLVAINQMNAPINLDLSSIANPVAGIVLMFIAAFAPYMAHKFIAFVGFDVHHVMSVHSEARQALNRPVPMPAISSLGSTGKIIGGQDSSENGQAGSPGQGGGPSGQGGGGGVLGGAGEIGGQAAGGAADGAAAAGQAAGAGGAGAAAGSTGLAAVAGALPLVAAAVAAPVAGAVVAHSAERHLDAAQSADATGHAAAGTPAGGGSQRVSGAMPSEPEGPVEVPAEQPPAAVLPSSGSSEPGS